MQRLLTLPGLVCGLQADGGGDSVEGAVAHDEPLIWGFQQHDETATLWPLCPWGLPQGLHNGVTPDVGQGMAAKLKVASTGEIRRTTQRREEADANCVADHLCPGAMRSSCVCS